MTIETRPRCVNRVRVAADPPSFVISRWPGFGVALAAGAPAALRCDVDANPPARAWWLRDDAHTYRYDSARSRRTRNARSSSRAGANGADVNFGPVRGHLHALGCKEVFLALETAVRSQFRRGGGR